MDIFNVLTLVGGLCLFLFGMEVMGQALERRAGGALRSILGKLTSKKMLGFLTGLAVTAVIQSSSATTVMVVGFVNSGLMSLTQAINVIMGANVGTTATAWLISLSGIDGDSLFLQLLKPTSFTPVLALIGVILFMFCKSSKKKDTGMILLGFATLMFGMDAMSGAVSGLKDVPAFQQLFVMFTNPIMGVLAGAILTAIIQSSSASVGILQALAVTGQVSYGATIPIIMGQNIGTCITAILSCIGANKNAKRAAMVHLSFNVIGTVIWLVVFWIVKVVAAPAFLGQPATMAGIAVAHSIFNIACTVLLLPVSHLLEQLAHKLVPDSKEPETVAELDERLLTTPAMALTRCHEVVGDMAACSVACMKKAMHCLQSYSADMATEIREGEERTDHYEDILSSYLVKLSALQISDSDSAEAAMLLKAIGDFERISDHSVNVLASVEEMRTKDVVFTDTAQGELQVLMAAVNEILDTSLVAFNQGDTRALTVVEPLEQVIDSLKERLRSNHIARLQQGVCSVEAGFIWADLLTDLERTADHCSNVAGCLLDVANHNMNIHETLRAIKADDGTFKQQYDEYMNKYALV